MRSEKTNMISHPKLAVDWHHGEEEDHKQRPPEVGVVSQHLALEAQEGTWEHHTTHLVVDVLQINVKLFPVLSNQLIMEVQWNQLLQPSVYNSIFLDSLGSNLYKKLSIEITCHLRHFLSPLGGLYRQVSLWLILNTSKLFWNWFHWC